MSAKKTTEKGNISIHTEDIFPIIKKLLYSDKEIFKQYLQEEDLEIRVESLKDNTAPAMALFSE